jgi:hypothetical protein
MIEGNPSAFRAGRFVAAAGVALCLLLGCGTPGAGKGPTPQGGGPITELHLFSSPVGLNFDDQPGVDGISVKVFASSGTQPKGVGIAEGVLEFVLHDGIFRVDAELPPVRKVWRYPSGDLAPHEFQGAIGIGYELALIWGADVPQSRLVSVSARLTRADGAVVGSAPSTVTITDLPRRPGQRFAPLGPAPAQP